jgi:hypothetical protein
MGDSAVIRVNVLVAEVLGSEPVWIAIVAAHLARREIDRVAAAVPIISELHLDRRGGVLWAIE